MSRKIELEHFRPFLGFEDKFGQTLRLESFLENKLSEQFQLYGYEEVSVPILEKGVFYSKKYVGSSPWPEWNERSMFELNVIDYDKNYESVTKTEKGVLIPEGTLSVCRWLSNLISERGISLNYLLPLKLYYSVKCFRNEPITDLSLRKKREFKQVGLEFLGPTTEMADIEVMYLISRGLESIGIPKDRINIRIGDIRLFTQLCKEFNIKHDERIILKEKLDKLAECKAVRKKREVFQLQNEINSFLRRLGITDLAVWEKLYSGTGNVEETVRVIKRDFGNEKVAESFRIIAEMLEFLGIPFEIDTCVVRSHEYYTNTVFEVDIKGKDIVHLEVAGGGRYNKLITNLLEDTTISIPATGFAYGLERLLNIINSEDIDDLKPKVRYFLGKESADYVIFPKNIKEAWRKAEELRKQWKRVDIYLQDGDKENAILYAKRKKAIFLEV